MNPRPIIVACIIAVLFVVAVYLGSKSVSEGRIEDTKEPTAEKPKGQVENTPTTPLRDTPTTINNKPASPNNKGKMPLLLWTPSRQHPCGSGDTHHHI
jgi:hypothetical protein